MAMIRRQALARFDKSTQHQLDEAGVLESEDAAQLTQLLGDATEE